MQSKILPLCSGPVFSNKLNTDGYNRVFYYFSVVNEKQNKNILWTFDRTEEFLVE